MKKRQHEEENKSNKHHIEALKEMINIHKDEILEEKKSNKNLVALIASEREYHNETLESVSTRLMKMEISYNARYEEMEERLKEKDAYILFLEKKEASKEIESNNRKTKQGSSSS